MFKLSLLVQRIFVGLINLLAVLGASANDVLNGGINCHFGKFNVYNKILEHGSFQIVIQWIL